MSYQRLVRALLTGRSYFGPVLRSLQGLPLRHQYFLPVVNFIAQRKTGPIAVLEIGSWAGASAISWGKAIRKLNRPGRVTCVDHWRPYFDMTQERDRHYVDMNEAAQSGDIFKLFLHNLKTEGVADMVDTQIGVSEAVLPGLPAKSFDIVYIDGSHMFQDVLTDLKEAKRLSSHGGIICGDDLELQKHQAEMTDHSEALLSNKDFVYSSLAKASYHPGVTEAVAVEFQRVSVWDGFWATRIQSGEWGEVELDLTDLEIPEHLIPALDHGEPKLCGEAPGFNLVKAGERYLAVAKTLGPTALFEERLGERELAPVLFTAETLEAIKEKALVLGAQVARPSIDLVGETPTFNLVKAGERYLAVAKTLGPTALFEERLGERELAPLVFLGSSLDDVKAKVARCRRGLARLIRRA